MYSPELRVYSTEIRVREARSLQARLLPNPALEGVVEDFGGTGAKRAFVAAESTLQVSQLIELAGKRQKRTAVSLFEKKLAQWDYQSRRLDVITKTKTVFIDLVLLQEKFILSEDLKRVAKEVYDTIDEKVKGGKITPLERKKAHIALLFSQLEMERNCSELLAARHRLISLWGNLKIDFQGVDGNLEITHLSTLEHNLDQVENNPDLARYCTEMQHSNAAVSLERSKWIPDPTISAGIKYYDETNDQAFVVGVSFPLPLFDRNQGNLLASRHNKRKTQEAYWVEKTRVESGLRQLYQEANLACSEVRILEEDILPDAEESFVGFKESYLQGKVDYLSLLDAQRTLFEVKAKHLEALARYHKIHILIDRLLGGVLDDKMGN